jgi:HK97 gp10 family phage protein
MAVKIKGLDKLIKDLEKFGDDGEKVVKKRIEFSATNIERNAINRVPFEFTFIRQRIDKQILDGGLRAKVGVQGTDENPLPAYVEFGTGLSAQQLLNSGEYDQDVRDIAIQFYKNGKGTLPANPYLFPSFFEERPKLIESLKKELDKLAKAV